MHAYSGSETLNNIFYFFIKVKKNKKNMQVSIINFYVILRLQILRYKNKFIKKNLKKLKIQKHF